MSKELPKGEAKELLKDLHKNDNATFKTYWNGAKKTAKTLSQMVIGAAAVATLATSALEIKGYDYHYPQLVMYALCVAWGLMAAVALKVLGKYLYEQGSK